MATCEKCKKRDICKEICPELQKEISNQNISGNRKKKTYAVDFNLLETNETLNSFQLEVIRKTFRDSFLKEITGIDLQDLIKKHLSEIEGEIVQLLLEGYNQQEIAYKMKISHQWVSILLKTSIQRLRRKYFLKK